MPVSIVFSKLALEDLDNLWDYLGIECDDVSAADSVVNKILDRINILSEFPELGTPLDAKTTIHSDYRFLVSGKYIAFYQYVNGTVYLVRILDGRSDYLKKIIGPDGPTTELYV